MLLFQIILATVQEMAVPRVLRIGGTFPQGDDKKGPSVSEVVDTVISVSYKADALYEPHKAYKSLALLFFWGSICI